MTIICHVCLTAIDGPDAIVSYKGQKYHLGCFIEHLKEKLRRKHEK